jgi:hypothetical protein
MTSFAAIDRLTASYLAFTLALIAWRADRIPGAAPIAAVNASLLLLVWWLSRSRARDIRPWSVVADWYPLALFVVFFEQIGSLTHAIASGWRDAVLIAIDYASAAFIPASGSSSSPWLVVWRYSARAGWLLTPLILSITVATVYGRYHYAVDVPAGVLVAIAGVLVAARLEGASQ